PSLVEFTRSKATATTSGSFIHLFEEEERIWFAEKFPSFSSTSICAESARFTSSSMFESNFVRSGLTVLMCRCYWQGGMPELPTKQQSDTDYARAQKCQDAQADPSIRPVVLALRRPPYGIDLL